MDANSSSDSDDEKPSQKGLTGVAIKEAPSLFSTPHCLMSKGDSKVLNDEDEYSYDDLVELINDFDDFMSKERAKFKELRKRHTSLQDSYEELKTAHEVLKETHEMLKEAHNSLITHKTNKSKVDMSIFLMMYLLYLI